MQFATLKCSPSFEIKSENGDLRDARTETFKELWGQALKLEMPLKCTNEEHSKNWLEDHVFSSPSKKNKK